MTGHAYLRPFWSYYGGKWRAAPRYPAPRYDTVIEPFAGAAGYSLRHYRHSVILIEKYPVVAGIWKYLISVSETEILKIPCTDAVANLPAWVPQEARWLVGFHMNAGTVSPCRVLSSGSRKQRSRGRIYKGWTEATRERVAKQVPLIKHWQIIEGNWWDAPDVEATWFVDPPYNNKAGSYYVHSDLDYAELAAGCRLLRGQAIVCENEGADWLPFEPFGTFQKNSMSGKASREVVWLGGAP